ncbi:MAG: hypothetical protein EBZ47_07525 [Chlamydiae bacterium]|nr:hypothetical protein [Chlamydiota bacterium]
MSFLQNPYQCVEVENAGLIKRASLDLGAITFIYGPNGSGKSTLLRGLKEFGSVIQNFINGVKTNKNSYFKEYAHKNKDLSFGLVYGSEKTHINHINRLLGDSLNWASEAIDSPNLSALHKFIKVKDNQLSVKVIKFSELDSVSIALFRDNDLLLIINPRANTIMTGEEIEIQNKSFPINQTLKYGGSIAQSVSQKTNGIFLKYTGDKFSDNDESNNNTIKEFEHLLSVQLNLVLHSRQITYVEPLRPILQNTDIFTLNDERVPFNCDEQAIRITNSWMMDPDKFNLQQRIVDVNYISPIAKPSCYGL